MPLIKMPRAKKASLPKARKSGSSKLPNSPKVDMTKVGYLSN